MQLANHAARHHMHPPEPLPGFGLRRYWFCGWAYVSRRPPKYLLGRPMEILLGALAEAILSIIANDLAQQPKLATLRERLRGNSREKLALQRALVKAFYSFKHRYPELSASFIGDTIKIFHRQPGVRAIVHNCR